LFVLGVNLQIRSFIGHCGDIGLCSFNGIYIQFNYDKNANNSVQFPASSILPGGTE
jgi:hypothetical protein